MRQMLTGWKKSEARAAREQLLAAREKGSPDPSDPNAKKVLEVRVGYVTVFQLLVRLTSCESD